jgi:hypothetical protein
MDLRSFGWTPTGRQRHVQQRRRRQQCQYLVHTLVIFPEQGCVFCVSKGIDKPSILQEHAPLWTEFPAHVRNDAAVAGGSALEAAAAAAEGGGDAWGVIHTQKAAPDALLVRGQGLGWDVANCKMLNTAAN